MANRETMQLDDYALIPYADLKREPATSKREFWKAVRMVFGMGVTINREYAVGLLKKVYSSERPIATGLQLLLQKNYYDARFAVHTLAVTSEHPVATFILGIAVLKSRYADDTHALDEAKVWLRMSADRGFAPACYRLSKLLFKADPVVARTYMARATKLCLVNALHPRCRVPEMFHRVTDRDLKLMHIALGGKHATAFRRQLKVQCWLHVFLALHQWRCIPESRNSVAQPAVIDKHKVIETMCFMLPPHPSDESVDIFMQLVYDKPLQDSTAVWLQNNEAEILRLLS